MLWFVVPISLFVLLSILINPGMLFYEYGIYIAYLKSILMDGDFNIINQIPSHMAWLATPTHFYPDAHPETQSAPLFLLYSLEKVAQVITGTEISSFQFYLSSISYNIFSLLLGFYFVKKTAEELNISFRLGDVLFFYFSCVILYFSLFQSTVIEIAAFPLIAYLFLVVIKCKKDKYDFSPLSVGIFAGFLMISKITFWPVSFLAVGYTARRLVRKKNWRAGAFLISGLVCLWICQIINHILKYGEYTNTLPPYRLFFDYSFENISTNFVQGFFYKGGLFVTNPAYFFGLVGFIILLKRLRRLFNFFDFFVLSLGAGFVFFHQIPILGYIVEDHLPGRIHLALAPLLLLGLSYWRQLFKGRKAAVLNALLVILSIWHILVTFGYIGIAQINSYLYAVQKFPAGENLTKAWSRYQYMIKTNAELLMQNWLQTLVFCVLMTGLVYLVARNQKIRVKFFKILAPACAALFIFMTALNYRLASANSNRLLAQGFYEGLVIGCGPEIYGLDYTIDTLYNIKARQNLEVNEKLELMRRRYYDVVKTQVLKSTPAFDRALATYAEDFSFWTQMEKKRSGSH